MKVFYSPDYVCADHSFDTTRKAKWIADSLARDPIPGVELVEPRPLRREFLLRYHHPVYVKAVETGEPRALAETQGFTWDAGLWRMVCASNGGVVAAAISALNDGVAGSLSSGLHHARYDHGVGYCTFNGLVIAAKMMLAAYSTIEPVLILDFDAHCGGGTASMIQGDPRIRQLDISVNPFDSYPGTENADWVVVVKAKNYLDFVGQILGIASQRSYGLCLYNAGMDPHKDSMGGLDGIDTAILAEREMMVFDWCRARKLPVAFVLAGGYAGPKLDQEKLVDLHRLTLLHAARPKVVC